MKKMLFIFLAISVSLSAIAASSIVKSTTEERIINGADVDYVQYIPGQSVDAKLFSWSGGDPAMNGSHLNLAVFVDNETGWLVYPLANVRNFKLLKSAKKGYLKISLKTDTVNSDGDIIQESSIMYIDLSKAASGSIKIEEVK